MECSRDLCPLLFCLRIQARDRGFIEISRMRACVVSYDIRHGFVKSGEGFAYPNARVVSISPGAYFPRMSYALKISTYVFLPFVI